MAKWGETFDIYPPVTSILQPTLPPFPPPTYHSNAFHSSTSSSSTQLSSSSSSPTTPNYDCVLESRPWGFPWACPGLALGCCTCPAPSLPRTCHPPEPSLDRGKLMRIACTEPALDPLAKSTTVVLHRSTGLENPKELWELRLSTNRESRRPSEEKS